MVRRVLFLSLFVILHACYSENNPEVGDKSSYYPIEIGNTWVYAQEETIYAAGLQPTTKLSYYKETIGEQIDQNQNTYLLLRSKSTNNQWEALPSKFIRRSPAEVSVYDNDEETILLKFPLYEGSNWRGNENEFNLRQNVSYYNRPDEGFTLEMKNDSSAIDFSREFIYFSKSSGPTFISKENYAFCQETPDCIGKGIISSGSKTTFTLLNRSGELPLN